MTCMMKKILLFSVLMTASLLGAPSEAEHQLLTASKEGRHSLVESLVQNKVNIDAKTFIGETPLILAALSGHLEIAHTLLSHGANANAQLKNGDTPLHMAIRNGNLPLVKLLMEHGATIIRPFTYALTFERFEVAGFIFSTYLDTALKKEGTAALQELLETFSSYKAVVKVDMNNYIEQLSKENDPNNREKVTLLKKEIDRLDLGSSTE